MKKISVTDIHFGYKKGKPVFEGFNLQLAQEQGSGKIIAIMGSSGSGKSTLMKLLLGLEKPLAGSINMQPTNPVFSYVPQEAVLFEHLTIRNNARYFQFAGTYKKRFDEQLYSELVVSLDLANIIDEKKSVLDLSGGQKQRLSLLRALSIAPDFLLLDEPCNGLDAEVKRSFLNKLREIAQRHQLFVLYITHHKLEAQLVADEVAYLVQDRQAGTVKHAARGSIQSFISSPPVLEAAYVFRFPDVKILPMKPAPDGNMVLAEANAKVTEYWLIENQDIRITANGGLPFKVVSKSAMYVTLRNEQSGTEWLISTDMDIMQDIELNAEVLLNIPKPRIKYK